LSLDRLHSPMTTEGRLYSSTRLVGHIGDPSDIHRFIGRVPRTFHPTGHLSSGQDHSCLSTLVRHDGPTAAVVCGLDDEVLPDARGGETLRETLRETVAGVMATSVVTRPTTASVTEILGSVP
jgi:hypothetical protein